MLSGRGVLRFEDFCRHTGLEPAVVVELMRSERLPGGLWRDSERTRPFGLFDDCLPTRVELEAMGLTVRSDYDPEGLRSFEMTDDEDDPD